MDNLAINNILLYGQNPCSGCGVCEVTCPIYCINIKLNSEGFYEPKIDNEKCTNCGLCIKVCYKYLSQKKEFKNTFLNKSIYGAWSKNAEILKTSSSGGVVQEFINKALEENYIICGVKFNAESNYCYHELAKTYYETEAFRGSKYLQSYTPRAFKQFKKDEKYLVIGTPCQIYGLRKYIQLKKWEKNFLLIDFFCHGTPTINLWIKYKNYISKKISGNISEMSFRNKMSGWHRNTVIIKDSEHNIYKKDKAFEQDLFFNFFLSDTCLTSSCYKCLLRLDYCFSDIRVADFWGKKYKENENGVTLIISNTELGHNKFEQIKDNLIVESAHFSDLQNSQRKRFLKRKGKSKKIIDLLKKNNNLSVIYIQTIMFPLFIKYSRRDVMRFIKKILIIFINLINKK